jgi:elongator complex protein 2
MVSAELAPAKTINQIVWRPGRSAEQDQQIAVATDDTSLRVYNVNADNKV